MTPAARTTRYKKVVEDPDLLEDFIDHGNLGQMLGLLRWLTAERVESEAIPVVKERIIQEMLGRHRRVDHREHYTMLSYLGDLGFEVVHLDTGQGDVATRRVSIERKEDDLIPSLFDDRRLRQLGAMREEAEFSYLIVTKSYDEIKASLRDRKVSERTFISFIASLMAVGYPPVFISDRYDASLLMQKVVDKIEDDNHRLYVPRPKSPKPSEYRNALMEGLPNVGPKTRRKLTAIYPTIASLCQASVEELSEVEGIGAATAQKIVDALSG